MIDYRFARPDDGPALDAMARQVWLETFGHSAPAADIAAYVAQSYGSQGTLIRDLADPAIVFRLAVDGDRIVGFAKLMAPWLDDVEPDAQQLSQLYIVADHHGRGIADALMTWTIEAARTRGAPALYLTVWEENARARRFYDRWGFVHVGDYAFRTGTQIDRDLIVRLAL